MPRTSGPLVPATSWSLQPDLAGGFAVRQPVGKAERFQYFGQVDINGRTGELTVRLRDIDGRTLFTQPLAPTR